MHPCFIVSFQGALQDVKIVSQSHGYLIQCPHQDTGESGVNTDI